MLFQKNIMKRNFKVKTGKEIHSVSQLILKDTLKYSSDQIKENLIMTSSIDEFMKIVNDGNYNRLNSGRILRNIQYKNIPKLFITSIALEYIEKRNLNEIIIEVNKNILGEIFIKYNKFNEYIKKENLLHLDELKPLLNGKEIIKELQIKPGKEIGVLLQSLLDKQIESPDFTRDCAIDFLNKTQERKAWYIQNYHMTSTRPRIPCRRWTTCPSNPSAPSSCTACSGR